MDEQASRPRLEDWTADEPAADFVERVMARVEEEARLGSLPLPRAPGLGGRGARWRAAAAGAAVALAVATAALVIVRRPAPAGRASVGSYLGSASRSTQQLGDRAVAVAEAGATLSWQLDDHGNGGVSQQRGSVFYRVTYDPARRFTVVTPQGQVRVTGTCFTVAVDDTATRVLVHEGSVAVQGGEHTLQLLAGERAKIADGAVSRLSEVAEAAKPRTSPPPVAAAIAAPAPAAALDGVPKINIDAATLREWAKRCYVRFDLPPFDNVKADDAAGWDTYARSMGATQSEVGVIREAFGEIEQAAFALVREIYTQATGDKVSEGEEFDFDRMSYEIGRSAEFHEQLEAVQRISAERAGLQAPPPIEKMPPIERLLRAMASQGDLYEAALAKRLGAARARQLRERQKGWPGPATEWEGCPKPRPPAPHQ
jgi:FecR protein